MPEFILDHGTPEAARVYAALDSFTQGYIEAAFFTDTGTGDDEEDGLEDATVAELAPDTLESIVADCARFQQENAAALQDATDGRVDDYEEQAAGRDFWYTRNGHGCGYWDRGLGDLGDHLADKARAWREIYVYRGDDDLIHFG